MTAQQIATPAQNAPMPPSFTTSPSEMGLITMIGYMEDLTTLYTEELSALEVRDMAKFADLQQIKNRLVLICEEQMHDLQKHSDALRLVNPTLKERLTTAHGTLSTLAEKSERECRIRAESVKRVQHRLLDAARYIVSRNRTRYDSNGKTNAARIKPDATSINEAI